MPILDRFLSALSFLTVLPVRKSTAPPADIVLFDYARDFPLVGILIGAMSGTVYGLASIVWDGFLPALCAVAVSLIVTGALHEDGLADTADGFGGGWTRDRRLTIMKDSRLGTYGVLALGLSVAFRTCALAELPPGMAFFALIAVHAAARFVPVLMLATDIYAGDQTSAKTAYATDRLPWSQVYSALMPTVAAMLPILMMRPFSTVLGLRLGGAMSFALTLYSRRAIGGYCGDVLGAAEQLFETGCLLGLAAAFGTGAFM